VARQAKEKANDAAAAAQLLDKERQAALARAAQAEEEAAAAVKDRDAAAARASEALARAAKECAAAAAAALGAPGGASSSTSSTSPPDLASTILLDEAMALLQLQAQAVAVNNIRNHVTTVLDVDSGNFNRWRDQFLLILGKFSLQDHVREEPPALISPDWARMDCVVKSWIVATLTDDLAEIISA